MMVCHEGDCPTAPNGIESKYGSPNNAVDHLTRTGFALLNGQELGLLADCSYESIQALDSHWQHLPHDHYLKDGGRYRQRRHASFTQTVLNGGLTGTTAVPAPFQSEDQGITLTLVPHRPHWQPTTYNALHGGISRSFEPISTALTDSPIFQRLITAIGDLFARTRTARPCRWYVEAHQFRITTHGGVGRPTPEGAHRDGVDFVAVLLVDRHRITGGETRVFDAAGGLLACLTLDQSWSVLLMNDNRVIHETTPIFSIQPHSGLDTAAGWRDTLVLTYRAGGFQAPPQGCQC